MQQKRKMKSRKERGNKKSIKQIKNTNEGKRREEKCILKRRNFKLQMKERGQNKKSNEVKNEEIKERENEGKREKKT